MKYVVDDILPAGLTVITAPPRKGKSWLSLQLSHSIANGIPFLGRNTTEGSVLYLDLKGSTSKHKKRMEKMWIKETNNFHVFYRCVSLGEGLHLHLKAWKNEHPDFRMVIVDEFDCILGKVGATQETLVHFIREWALQEGVAVVLVTNMLGKARRAKVREIESAWIIKKDRKNTVLLIRGDHVKPSEIPIRFDRDACQWIH